MLKLKPLSFCVASALFCLHATGAQETTASFTDLTYPAYGNLKQTEGTLIVWFRDDEPQTPPDEITWAEPRKRFSRYLVAKIEPNPDNVVLLFNRHLRKGKMGLHSSLKLPGEVSNIGDKPGITTGWKEGDINWIAYTWDREGNHRLYANGALVGTRIVPRPELGIGSIDPNGRVVIGGPDSAITVLGVHTLIEALDEQTMQSATPENLFQPKETTLLLDRMDNIDFATGQSSPMVISSYTGPATGQFGPAAQTIKVGKSQALQLYTRELTRE